MNIITNINYLLKIITARRKNIENHLKKKFTGKDLIFFHLE